MLEFIFARLEVSFPELEIGFPIQLFIIARKNICTLYNVLCADVSLKYLFFCI